MGSCMGGDDIRCEREKFSIKEKFDAKYLAKNMHHHKEYFEHVQSFVESCRKDTNKNLTSFSVQYGGGEQLKVKTFEIFCEWNIGNDYSTLTLKYSFKDNGLTPQIFNIFEKTKNEGVINESFGNNFPSLIVYDKEAQRYTLTFSTNDNLKIPQKEDFVDLKMQTLKLHHKLFYKNLKFFNEYKNQKCPIYKKIKFNIGKKIYNNLLENAPNIVDNKKQDKINSYNEIESLMK